MVAPADCLKGCEPLVLESFSTSFAKGSHWHYGHEDKNPYPQDRHIQCLIMVGVTFINQPFKHMIYCSQYPYSFIAIYLSSLRTEWINF